MAKKKKHNVAELADDERELFLNTFYQGGHLAPDPPKSSPKKELELELDEQELFLRAMTEGFEHRPKEERPREQRSPLRKKAGPDSTIDLHGMFAEDAVVALLRFLERERHKGSRSVLVVHGKGAGILKNAISSVVDNHPLVEAYWGAPGKWGGQGAMILRLSRKIRRF